MSNCCDTEYPLATFIYDKDENKTYVNELFCPICHKHIIHDGSITERQYYAERFRFLEDCKNK